MDLLILNGSWYGEKSPYRGTFREAPYYYEALPGDHEINQLFVWYVEFQGEPTHNLDKALRYTQLCNAYFSEKHFEVIEITHGEAKAESGGKFLGFDLSNGILSLLSYGFVTEPRVRELPKPTGVLCEVVDRFFAPYLNSSGLFDTFDIASLCLRSMNALQSLFPGSYESKSATDLHEYEVIGIYLVPEGNNGILPARTNGIL